MDFGHLLNSFTPATPPPTQPTRPNPPDRVLPTHCRGYLGRFAEGHLLLKNNKCSIKACYHCCNELNTDSVCRTHASQSKRKVKEAQQQQLEAAPPNGSNSNDVGSTSNSYSETAPTQAGRLYTRKLTSQELDKFKTLAIEKQAFERLHKASLNTAKKNITLLLWSNPNTEPHGLLAHAPQWPLLALDESEDLMKVVQETLGNQLRHSLQVWNEHDEIWLLTPTNMIQSYASDRRKILIRLPTVNESDCKGLELHKVQMAASLTKGSMDLCYFLTPSSSNKISRSTPIHTHSTPIRIDSSPINAHQSRSPSNSDIQILSTADSEPTTDEEGDVASSLKWPHSVSMIQMLAFFDASTRPKTHIKAAWSEVFGSPHMYKKSTVTRYRQWLGFVPQSTLDKYITTHGSKKTIHQATRYFHDTWAKSAKVVDSKPTKHHKT
ncbi:uncharacterized protein MELLADRAFT_84256 [Melampsora larici-populina 98AG31]|uniref:Uncharacterized protein n=1 Tax=Melampsora larici-populina (strain 98AG31 / pathotype 3-4-7) TaxID=747676 RepID=F4RF26_MELLP|nr:uncharacterized protein MELLADRAFT_84256 [Melampsora larici-populina 98AG31]EGG09009.1 hypothetical protein MELLADRAFT_84256 [Melampsora larici-populina 98AG31]